jgi:hypothetical protein
MSMPASGGLLLSLIKRVSNENLAERKLPGIIAGGDRYVPHHCGQPGGPFAPIVSASALAAAKPNKKATVYSCHRKIGISL